MAKINNFGRTCLILLNILICLFIVYYVVKQKHKNIIAEEKPPLIQELEKPKVEELIKEEDVKQSILWLSHDDREGRMSGKRGNIEAANYIKETFEELGLKTSLQKIPIKRMNPGPKNEIGDDFTHNIIGVLPGKTDKKIIIAGHMDHIGYGPRMSRSPNSRNQIHNGADDNATGTVAVLELAKALSQEKLNHTIVFIAFSAEEMGLIGSRYYVKNLTNDEINDIDLMMNFDMIGWLKDNDLRLIGIDPIPELKEIFNEIDDKYPFKVISGGAGSGGSDHASFGNVGIPFIFFHTGLHEHYHKPTDDFKTIDIKGTTQIIKMALEAIKLFDKTPIVRTTSILYPKLNDTVPDHGSGVPFPIESDFDE